MSDNNQKGKYKLVCFDLDGTIIDNITNFWKFICDEFGCDTEKKKQAYDNFFNNLITYDEWVEGDVKLWMDKGLKKEDFLESLGKLKLMPGALETIKTLKSMDVKVAVISDSMEVAIEALIPDFREMFDDVLINRLQFDDNGRIKGWEATRYGMEKKADGLRMIAEREGLSLSECVFVGDAGNDIQAVKAAGLGIAFNSSSEELEKSADVVIRKKDLSELLNHI
ncbi:MAG: HAD family phosphatase [Candidatus Woesearchaeota archaeon]